VCLDTPELTLLLDSCMKDIALEGEFKRLRSSVSFSDDFCLRPNPVPFCPRLVRPHKVSAIQERYAAYGDRVEIGPLQDLVKEDFTAALKGAYHEYASGTLLFLFEREHEFYVCLIISSRRRLCDSPRLTITRIQ
jgi:hypothetical protein